MKPRDVVYVRRGPRGKAHALFRRSPFVTFCGLAAAASAGPWVELTKDDKERVPVCRTCISLLDEWPPWVAS